jgi:hypothetical protein
MPRQIGDNLGVSASSFDLASSNADRRFFARPVKLG